VYGLTVRWSLAQAPDGVEQTLRDYVTGSSLARFTAMDGLRFKTWRMRPAEWFEGTYVWASAAERDTFAAQFGATGADNPGSQLIGHAPDLIETFEVVAVAEGRSGFSAGAGPGDQPQA
jgi:hypothetical protein